MWIAFVSFWGGCSEDVGVPDDDTAGPEVRVAFPPHNPDSLWVVSDSVDVYVAALDPGAVARVDLWYYAANGSLRRIGEALIPVDHEDIPEPIRTQIEVPESWRLFRFHWITRALANGERPRLTANAYDVSENVGRSEPLTVLIINDEPSMPPETDFRISSTQVALGEELFFDPSPTRDTIDPPKRIQVRWDFEGDGIWEIGWDDEATVLDEQVWRYPYPGEYLPTLQARNSYFEQPSEPFSKIVLVNSDCGGPPEPPPGMDFVQIDPGTYRIGAGQEDTLADRDERPAFQAILDRAILIQRVEVSNAQYLEFLVEQYEQKSISIHGQQVYRTAANPDSAWLFLDLETSRVYFDIDRGRFDIEPGYREHPVTGVTWYGASGFARRYCLRLPTEAEWEIAARGDSLGWRYPFPGGPSDGPGAGSPRANFVESGDPFDGGGGTTPVGFFDGRVAGGFETIDTPSYFGTYDQAGNVAEWVADWYGPYRSGTQNGPQGPPTGTYKVVRGGSYVSTPDAIRVTARDGDRTPEESFATIGFRVAYVPVR